MHWLKVILIFLAAFFLFPIQSFAVIPSNVSLEKVFTQKDGLSHLSVLAVAVGSDHIFIGTERNLTVWGKDGKVTIWGPNNSPLKLQRVPALAVRGKELWTTCRSPVSGGGTFRWDGLQWQAFEEIKDDMQSNYITCFHVDDKDMLWIGSEDQGVNYYVFETNPFRKFGYLASKKGLLENRISCLASRPGETWIGTLSGISVYRGKDGEKYLFTNYSKATGLPADHIIAIAVNPERVYVATTMGLMIFENNAWRLISIAEGLADNWLTCLALDGNDLWIGTKKGLQLYRGGKFEPPIDYRDGLPSSHIQCITVDRSSLTSKIYVGTDRGLVVLRRQ